MLWFGPGRTAIFSAVAWPKMVSLTSMLIFTNGIVAEYSVGFVMFNLASKVIEDLEVSRISKSPTLGKKLVRFPPEIAATETLISQPIH